MCYYGNGYGFYETYTMPIHIRRFHYNKLIEYKKKESKDSAKATPKVPSKVRVKK